MGKALRVLNVEDSLDDSGLLARELREGGYELTFERVDSLKALAAALGRQVWDLLISDFHLPGFNGFDVLARTHASKPDMPVIILSGTIGEETAAAMMKAGARDFVSKEHPARLLPAIERELREAGERRSRMQAEARYRRIVDAAYEGIFSYNAQFQIDFANQRLADMLGYSIDELLGCTLRDFCFEEDLQDLVKRKERRKRGIAEQFDFRMRRKDGSALWTIISTSPALDEQGEFSGSYAMVTDISARKVAEEQLKASEQQNRRHARRLQMLNETTQAFAEAATDPERLLGIASKCLGELIGDVCLIRLVSEDGGWLEASTVYPSDPETRRFVQGVLGTARQRVDEGVLGEIMRCRRALFLPQVSPERGWAILKPETIAPNGDIEPLSLIVVPMRSQDRVIGLMMLVKNRHGLPYTEDDLMFAQDLADRAGLAVEYARLYSRMEQQVNDRTAQLTAANQQLGVQLGKFENANRELDELSNYLDKIINSIADPIFIKDRQHLWVMLNDAFCELVGHPKADLLGKSDFDFFPPAEASAFWSGDDQVFSTGREDVSEENFTDAAGRVHIIATKKTLYVNQRGEPFIVGIIRDITERKELEQAIQVQNEQLKTLDRLKTDFVNAVTHDLRTPLTSIKGYAEFLEDGLGGQLSPQQREFVLEIEKASTRLENLVNDLLDFARLEAGTFKLQLRTADLGDKVREIANSLRPQVEAAHLTLDVSIADSPLKVRFDPQRIGQVLTNLLHNAIKFSPEGGTIHTTLRVEGDGLVCEVRDSGPGIAPEEQDKLFRRFSQLESGVIKGGTGLGLSISKSIIEAHGGAIGVKSEVGSGSTFWFSLPYSSDSI